LSENGLYKLSEGRASQRTVQLEQGPSLLVSDDGEAVDPHKAGQLFMRPVDSESGLGVGLYQAAGFAAKNRYQLQLAENRQGRVCFALRPQSEG
ncbi:MAG: sensor histidine kinase, partial [Betaproteobacteria bacterium]